MIDPMKLARMQAVAQALSVGCSDAYAKGDRAAAAGLFTLTRDKSSRKNRRK